MNTDKAELRGRAGSALSADFTAWTTEHTETRREEAVSARSADLGGDHYDTTPLAEIAENAEEASTTDEHGSYG